MKRLTPGAGRRGAAGELSRLKRKYVLITERASSVGVTIPESAEWSLISKDEPTQPRRNLRELRPSIVNYELAVWVRVTSESRGKRVEISCATTQPKMGYEVPASRNCFEQI